NIRVVIKGDAKSIVRISTAGRISIASRTPAALRVTQPGSVAKDAPLGLRARVRRRFGIRRLAERIGCVDVAAPFVDIARHIEEAEGMRLLRRDRMRAAARVRLEPSETERLFFFGRGVPRCRRSRASGVLPLGLAWQPDAAPRFT